jgi:pantoate--beta-alanine ligase
MTTRPLQIVSDSREMRIRMEDLRRDGRKIVFVPTMGYLHQGHVSLLEEGRRRGDVLVLSIFVNPTQFAAHEDLDKYPRDMEGDLAKARGAGTDFAFTPDAKSFYPPGYQTWVQVRQLSQGLCGDKRPGHFDGVASVVTKLFHVVQPHTAIFGEKDFQQLAVIRRMVKDLDFGIEIVGMPTVREPDGLAMSSRNAYLKPEERQQALVLSRALAKAQAMVAAGERRAATILEAARAEIAAAPLARIDYCELRDPDSLELLETLSGPTLMALAVFVGATRLIDNKVLRFS